MIHSCRICGKTAKDVVTSYNHHSWMCNEHVEVFMLFVTHWEYMKHESMPYDPHVEPQALFSPMSDTGQEPGVTKIQPKEIKIMADTPQGSKKDYSYALYDPEAKGFARPRGKHLKVSPRWTGMSTHDANEKHGEVKRKGVVVMTDTVKPLSDIDYASKAAIWDSSTIYTKV